MYGEVTFTRNRMGKFYVPMYLTRQFLFILMTALLVNHPCFQIQFLLILHPFFITWYLTWKPHNTRKRRIVEFFNDWFIQMGTYHMILFSNFVLNPRVQFYCGYSFFIWVLIMIVFNIIKIIIDQITEVLRERRLNKILKAKMKKMNELKKVYEIIT